MAFMPSDSAIKVPVNSTLEEKVFNAKTHYEVAEILRQAAVDQHLVQRDIYSPDVLIPVDQPAPGTPRAFAKSVTVDGEKHIFESATEEGANEALLAFIRESANEPAERPRDSESGRFVARTDDTDPVAKAELELKFKRGEISTEDYLAQSGAIERHLEAQGISIEALQQATNERTAASWAQATQEFLATSDWPGGNHNRDLLGEVLVKMGADKFPNAENLRLAYQWLKDNDRLLPNEVLEAQNAIGTATSPEELREAALRSQGRTSSMFNR